MLFAEAVDLDKQRIEIENESALRFVNVSITKVREGCMAVLAYPEGQRIRTFCMVFIFVLDMGLSLMDSEKRISWKHKRDPVQKHCLSFLSYRVIIQFIS